MKQKNNRKLAVWNKITFCIEFGSDGEVLLTKELAELFDEMKSSINKLAFKSSIKLYLDADDCRQALALATMELLAEWKPAKSAWGTFWVNYAYRRLINITLPKHAGYRLREEADSALLEYTLCQR